MKAQLSVCMFSLLFVFCTQSPKVSNESSNNADSAIRTDSSSRSSSKEPRAENESNADTNQKAKPAKEADPIAYIRQQVSHINTSKLEKKHFEYMCDEKTKIDYFYENGEIKKISVDFSAVGDVYSREDYYYHQGKLIFIYKFHELLMPCNGCDQIKEYRSYIQNDRVIRNLEDKDQLKCTECNFGPSSKKYRLLKAETASEMKAILCS